MAKATAGTVTFRGETYTVSTSFEFASFYYPNFREHDGQPMIRFHRTLQSAQRGTWDSKEMRAAWEYVGFSIVER